MTDIAAGAVSGTWTAAGSPYRILGDIYIPSGQKLTIQPGVEVRFQGHYRLEGPGIIDARGTSVAQRDILFTAENTATGWYGIRIWNRTGTVDAPPDVGAYYLQNCIIEYVVKDRSNPRGFGDSIYNDSRGALYVYGASAYNAGSPEQYSGLKQSDLHLNGLMFRHCKALANTSPHGAGAGMYFNTLQGSVHPTWSDMVFDDCHSASYGAAFTQHHGGAITFLRATMTNGVSDDTATPSTSTDGGSGTISYWDVTGPVTLDTCTLSNNTPSWFAVDATTYPGVVVINPQGSTTTVVSPKTPSITAGTTQAFTATSGASGVTWSVVGGSGNGTLSNVTSTSVTYTAPSTPGTYTLVATSVNDGTKTDSATIVVTAVVSPPSTSSGKWVTGYYAAYYSDSRPVSSIDMSQLTHAMLAFAMPNNDGTITVLPGGVYAQTQVIPFIQRAHNAGKKAMLMGGGMGAADFFYAATSDALRPAFVTNILAALDAKKDSNGLGFDGFDIDWEGTSEGTSTLGSFINVEARRRCLALAADLRAARPSIILTFAAPWLNNNAGVACFQSIPASFWSTLAASVDQFNVMSYATGLWWTETAHFNPLAGATSTRPYSITDTVALFAAAGVPKAKMGIGLGFYSNVFGPPNTAVGQSKTGTTTSNEYLLQSNNIIAGYLAQQPGNAQKVWDATAKQYYLTAANWTPTGLYAQWNGGAQNTPLPALGFMSYEDEASIRAKAKFVRDQGLGGTIVWTIDSATTNYTTGANPYMQAVKDAFLDPVPATPIISRGVPAYASSGTASNGNSSTYLTPWTSAGENPAWLAYDLSGVPADRRGNVIVFWHNDRLHDFNPTNGTLNTGGASYTIQAHAGAGGGAAPAAGDAGWVTLATVTGCNQSGRQHSVNLTPGATPYNWVRIRITTFESGSTASLFMDVHDASQGPNDDFTFFGDSINEGWATHYPYGSGDATAAGCAALSLSDMILAARPGKFPLCQAGGTVGDYSSNAQSSFAAWLTTVQGKYVSLGYGTNEALNAWTGQSYRDLYINAIQAMITAAQAAGKTVILPRTIPWGTNSSIQTYGPTINGWIATLLASNPTVIPGPDQWAWGQAHAGFQDGIHYGNTGGYLALRRSWADWMLSTIYAGQVGQAPPATGHLALSVMTVRHGDAQFALSSDASQVLISTTLPGATIYWSTTGVPARSNANRYTGPITVPTGSVISVRVYARGKRSRIIGGTYTVS